MSSLDTVRAALVEAQFGLQNLMSDTETLGLVAQAGELLAETFAKGGRVFSCGNGGSMSDAMHFAEELSGRFRRNRAPLPAAAISDVGHLTCTANDYGYEHVFSRYLEAHARTGDAVLCITTSGQSPNILNAAQHAKQKGVTVIGLTGKRDAPLKKLSDLFIATPAGFYADRVQELHIKVIHIIIEIAERRLFPENYV